MAEQRVAGAVLLLLGVFGAIASAFLSGWGVQCCGISGLMFLAGLFMIIADKKPSAPAPVQYAPYPVMPPMTPSPPPTPPQRRTVFCTRCGSPATWIPEYARWYCYADQAYLSNEIPPPGA